MRLRNVVAGLVGVGLTATALASCGQASTPRSGAAESPPAPTTSQSATEYRVPALDPQAKQALRVGSVDVDGPYFPIRNPQEFDVVALGTVITFRRGPSQAVFEGDEAPIGSIVLEMKVTNSVAGPINTGDSLFVRLVIDDLAGITKAVPPGTLVVVASSVADTRFDRYLDDPRAGVERGAVRYISGAPYLAFADGPLATWFPMLRETVKRPLTDLLPDTGAGIGEQITLR